MPQRISSMTDYAYIASGNVLCWISIIGQNTIFSGEDFRTWTSWAIGLTVGVLTIIKLRKDIKSKSND